MGVFEMEASTQAVKTAYDSAMENFDLAADALNLSVDVRNMLKYPERILHVNLPVRMDSAYSKVRGLPGSAQHGAGPGQGWNSLSSRSYA